MQILTCEVQYYTMRIITAVVAAAQEEQASPHHPLCVYHPTTAVQQSTAEKPIHQQPTVPPCVYNNSTAVQQKKSENTETGRFN